MNNLSLYGWNEELFRHKQSSQFKDLIHGRVSSVNRTCYEVVCEEGPLLCELTGNMLYGRAPEEYPCTGDWVLLRPMDVDRGIIFDVLPRSRTLYRKKTGTVSGKQMIAAHVDKAFIVQGLDSNFNVRRIERFMVQVLDEGITPVLVLTKADLGYDENFVSASLEHLSGKMPLFISSIHDREKIEALRNYIGEGETVVFTGSSGVGKSTLVNALCGREILGTHAVSGSTGKGVHTTTRREMILLDGSGVLIDTPGVREFGVILEGEDTLASVMNISDLEGSCRFEDCSHTGEPGCAVAEALANGRLKEDAYESYLKLRKESSYFASSVHERRKRERSFTKLVKEVKDLKKGR